MFLTLSDHQRQLDEVRQSRNKETSAQRYPNVELDGLAISESENLSTTASEDAGFRFGSGLGYDYTVYRSAGNWRDEFDRGTIESNGYVYRGEEDFSPSSGVGMGDGNGLVTSFDSSNKTLHTTADLDIGAPGRKMAWHYLNDGSGTHRRFTFNVQRGGGDGTYGGRTNHFFVDVDTSSNYYEIGYKLDNSETTLGGTPGNTPNGWTRIEVTHETDFTELSVRRVDPLTLRSIETLAYAVVPHNNPLSGKRNPTDMGIESGPAGVFDLFTSS